MFSELLLSIYCGSLFLMVTIVAPVLLRVEENKNFSGRLYGKILWRFYAIAFPILLFYLIFGDERFMAFVLMLGLGINVGISHWLKSFKRSMGNIDHIEFDDPRRRLFRKVSMASTFILLLNFILSCYAVLKNT